MTYLLTDITLAAGSRNFKIGRFVPFVLRSSFTAVTRPIINHYIANSLRTRNKQREYLTVSFSGMMLPDLSTSSNRTRLTPSVTGTMSGLRERSRALSVFLFMHLTNFGKYSLWSMTSFTSTN